MATPDASSSNWAEEDEDDPEYIPSDHDDDEDEAGDGVVEAGAAEDTADASDAGPAAGTARRERAAHTLANLGDAHAADPLADPYVPRALTRQGNVAQMC